MGRVGLEAASRISQIGIETTQRPAAQFDFIAELRYANVILVGTIPPKQHVISGASEGVARFLARYGARRPSRK